MEILNLASEFYLAFQESVDFAPDVIEIASLAGE
jgi:hypothetical protein